MTIVYGYHSSGSVICDSGSRLQYDSVVNSYSEIVHVMLPEIYFHVLYCVASEWILVVFAVASIGLIFALAFKSKEYPTNFILLAAFVSIVSRTLVMKLCSH